MNFGLPTSKNGSSKKEKVKKDLGSSTFSIPALSQANF